MTISAAEVADIVQLRRKTQQPRIAMMDLMKSAYNGQLDVVLPELERNERPATPNLIAQGIDQLALRAASVLPQVVCPSTDESSKTSEKRAKKRRDAIMGWWQFNKMDLVLAQRARHLLAYATAPVQVRWDPLNQVPEWVVMDPCFVLPGQFNNPNDLSPEDSVFIYERTFTWLKDKYPGAASAVRKANDNLNDLTTFQIAHYVDVEQEAVVLMGSQSTRWDQWSPMQEPNSLAYGPSAQTQVMLEWLPNRCGYCPVVMPRRIGLDQLRSRFDSLIGMYQMQAKLMALEVIAVQKGIFPDVYMQSNPGEIVKLINEADGIRGEIGKIQGGTINVIQTNPGFMTNPTIDHLERNQRIEGGIPAEFGGESTTNIRTGRRGDAVLSATVDFPIQEIQKMFIMSLQQENRIAIALMRHYGGNTPRTFYVHYNGTKGHIDYDPSTDFETDENLVSYSHPGSDLPTLVVQAGQRIGMKTMSKQRFMELDPLIDDVESEHDNVIAEALEEALLQGLQAQAAQGSVAPNDIAYMIQAIRSDQLELAEAVVKIHEMAQARQATVAPAGSPQTQPGLAQPGVGAEQPAAAAPQGPPPIAALLQALQNRPSSTAQIRLNT